MIYNHHRPIRMVYDITGAVVDSYPEPAGEIISIGDKDNKLIIEPYHKSVELVGDMKNKIKEFCLYFAREWLGLVSLTGSMKSYSFARFCISEDKIEIDVKYPLSENVVEFMQEVNKNWPRILKTVLLLG